MSKVKEFIEDAKELGLIPKPTKVYIVAIYDIYYKQYITSKVFLNKHRAYNFYYNYIHNTSDNLDNLEELKDFIDNIDNSKIYLEHKIYSGSTPVYTITLDELAISD